MKLKVFFVGSVCLELDSSVFCLKLLSNRVVCISQHTSACAALQLYVHVYTRMHHNIHTYIHCTCTVHIVLFYKCVCVCVCAGDGGAGAHGEVGGDGKRDSE